jgi:hypothetical protein
MDINKEPETADAALKDWCKWMSTIHVFAASGCVVALKTTDNPSGKAGPLFFFAIIFFGLGILLGSMVVLLLAGKQTPKPKPVQFLLHWLPLAHWVLFGAGLVALLSWVGVLTGVLARS